MVESASTLASRRVAVSAGFGVQAFGYAALTAALPVLQVRTKLSTDELSLVILAMVVGAIVGTLLADVLAVRRGSRFTLLTGVAFECLTLTTIAFSTSPAVLIGVLVLHGIGLGIVDVGCNMQGSLLERSLGRPVFGQLFATATASGILSTLVTIWALSAGWPGTTTLVVGAALHLCFALLAGRFLDTQRAAREPHKASTRGSKLPTRTIYLVGLVVFAAFVVDTAVSTWAAVYGKDVLSLPANLVPLSYGIYLAMVLVARLVLDPLILRFGRARLALLATVLGVLGMAVLTLGQPLVAVFVGFAVGGFAAGWLVPLAFARAGELVPSRSDEVLARVNLFNGFAAIIGAVLPALIAGFTSINWAFLLPLVALLACLPALRTLGRSGPETATGAEAPSGASAGTGNAVEGHDGAGDDEGR